jgi:type I restriction enzyme S subunit
MEVRPGYKLTDVGVIPGDWDVCSIDQMFRLVNGCAFKPEDWKQTGVPIIRIQNLNDPSADYNYSQAPVPERNRVEPGDLLFAWSGTIGTSFGARVWAGPSGVLNQHIFKVHIDESRMTLQFSLLVFARVEDQIAKKAHGFKSSFVHVKKSDLVKVSLPIPPLPEQRAIATALSDVDALLAGLDQLIAKKRDLKQAAMQQLLTGQTRLPGFQGGWEKILARGLGVFKGGSGFPLIAQGETGGEYPFFKVSDMNNDGNEIVMAAANHYISEKTRERLGAKAFPPESIVFAKVGAAVFLERKKILGQASCIDNNMAAFVLDKGRVNVRYMHYLLLSKRLGDLVTTTALPALNAKQLGDMPLTIPPLAEQTAIAIVLSEMDAELTALEARRDKTSLLKQAMMQELLTGRTRLV